MSKIFEALDNTPDLGRWVGLQWDRTSPAPAAVADRLSVPGMFSQVNMGQEMVSLHQHVEALLPGKTPWVIQFIGSRKGEGTSTVAHEFARVSATRFAKRVLLLDADRRTDSPGRGSAVPSTGCLDIPPSQVGNMTLSVLPLPWELTPAWEELRTKYDLVLIDSPPAAISSEGFAVSSHADGVILVVEADATRWPVAERVKESIDRSGGRVLGLVLNKRRYYIPPFIYRRL
jgi:Mrp family chromosome partitioning ATPase